MTALRHLLTLAFDHRWMQEFLDPGEAVLDSRFNTVDADDGWTDEKIRAEFEEWVARARSDPRSASREFPNAWLPGLDGPHAQAWLDYLADLMRQATDPSTPLEGVTDGRLPALGRASRFDDKDTANWAATMAVRAHEPVLRKFYANSLGVRRLWCYTRLDREIGTVVTSDSTARASAVAVQFRWRDDRQTAYIHTCYPDVDLPEEPRDRWPELSWLLGGYFGQDWPEDDRTVWDAECAWQTQTHQRVKTRVVTQLRELLAETTATDLPDTTKALGCYVLPPDLPGWLTRIADRTDRTALWPDDDPVTPPGAADSELGHTE